MYDQLRQLATFTHVLRNATHRNPASITRVNIVTRAATETYHFHIAIDPWDVGTMRNVVQMGRGFVQDARTTDWQRNERTTQKLKELSYKLHQYS